MRHQLAFLGALLLVQVASADVINVQNLNQQLKTTNATWVAKPNHLTPMSKADARHMMGLNRAAVRDVEFVNSEMKFYANLPQSIDWRNKDGKNWVSPILDQGNCGSCVAFASIGALETQYRISSLYPDFNMKLSPQHLFSCGGGACDWGWTPDSAASYIQKTGVPDEACMPYQSGATGEDVACRASCPDASQRSVRIASYTTPSRGSQDRDAVKQALLNGPLVTTLSVYADFIAYAGGVYKHTTGDELGGHAVSIVGYDDTKNAWIIRNSWAQDWGEGGFAYVSYDDESGVGDETWSYTMPAMSGGVSVESPTDYSYFTGTADIKSYSSFGSTSSLGVAVYDKDNKAVAGATCNGDHCAQGLDVSGLADGRYEVQVTALDSHGSKLGTSERHFFYVVNKNPQYTITFQGSDGTDLGSSLSDRIIMEIDTASSSVPLSSIEFHNKGPDGKENVRPAGIVPAKMTMGWRTNLVANGQYEIWYVGHLKSNGIDMTVESDHKSVSVKN